MKKITQGYKRELKQKILAERFAELPDSSFQKIMKLAEECKGIISLGPGEPDFTTPKNIIDAGKKALDEGFTHYSPPQGRKELRELIAKKAKKENKIECSPENIIVTSGSTEGILLSVLNIVDPSEEILTPNPGFIAYIPIIELMDAVPVSYYLNESNGFHLDIEEIKKKISKKTRGIILNTPSNPTGTVYKKKVLEEIAGIAIENELMVISDEAYEKFVYGNAKHISIASLNGMQSNVITLHSFSKTYAMPGFRIGYAIAPEWFTKCLTRLHVYSTLCAPTISQKMAEAALSQSQKEVQNMRNEYERRRKMILKKIKELHALHVEVEPEGAFYVFPKIKYKNFSSHEFAEFLLKEAKVLVVPGNEFGSNGEGFIRLSYATNYELIEEAMQRIAKATK